LCIARRTRCSSIRNARKPNSERYFKRVAKACTDPTLAKWKDRLAGADVFTESNCGKMSQSLRGDNNLLS
jgi:hypothetical protein